MLDDKSFVFKDLLETGNGELIYADPPSLREDEPRLLILGSKGFVFALIELLGEWRIVSSGIIINHQIIFDTLEIEVIH